MILASSNAGDTVLDPFVGSGTTLHVCQQLGRNCIGIDINPAYVKMSQDRLSEPFNGFDSIDERMKRLPEDLNDSAVREEYIQNHLNWFLKNNPNVANAFIKSLQKECLTKQIALFT